MEHTYRFNNSSISCSESCLSIINHVITNEPTVRLEGPLSINIVSNKGEEKHSATAAAALLPFSSTTCSIEIIPPRAPSFLSTSASAASDPRSRVCVSHFHQCRRSAVTRKILCVNFSCQLRSILVDSVTFDILCFDEVVLSHSTSFRCSHRGEVAHDWQTSRERGEQQQHLSGHVYFKTRFNHRLVTATSAAPSLGQILCEKC